MSDNYDENQEEQHPNEAENSGRSLEDERSVPNEEIDWYPNDDELDDEYDEEDDELADRREGESEEDYQQRKADELNETAGRGGVSPHVVKSGAVEVGEPQRQVGASADPRVPGGEHTEGVGYRDPAETAREMSPGERPEQV